jgi:hypothetical protein
MHSYLARFHQTIRVTRAMEAGISDQVRTLEEIIYLTDGTRTHFRLALDSATASKTAMQRAPSRKLG